jgi:hypothetical protein
VFEKASLLGWCQASEKKPDPNEINEDLLGTDEPFIVFTQAPLPSDPGKRPLDHPAWLHLETSSTPE